MNEIEIYSFDCKNIFIFVLFPNFYFNNFKP